jgi:hypothetical protein
MVPVVELRRVLLAVAGALCAACAHTAAPPAQAEERESCREVRLSEQRYRDAERACAVFSKETFNWHDCMVARGAQPALPPPYFVYDEPDCPHIPPSTK